MISLFILRTCFRYSFIIYEKTCLQIFRPGKSQPVSAVTKASSKFDFFLNKPPHGLRLGISDVGSRGIVLSV